MSESLAQAIETAGDDQQRALLEEAYAEIYPWGSYKERGWSGMKADQHRDNFRRMLDAGAWMSAALMLIPDGVFPTIDFVTCRAWLRTAEGYDLPHGPAYGCSSAPALALLAAILKAKEAGE